MRGWIEKLLCGIDWWYDFGVPAIAGLIGSFIGLLIAKLSGIW